MDEDDDAELGEPLWADEPTRPRPVFRSVVVRRGALRRLAQRPGGLAFLPGGEVVHVDRRRHPVVLLPAVARTLAGLAVLLAGTTATEVVVLVLATAWWASLRVQRGAKRNLLVAAAALAAVLLLGAGAAWLAALGLVLWLAEDAAAWWNERIIITGTRLYHRHGWLTRHSPSVAVSAALFLDVSEGPLERLLGCGTLRLDSAARRDRPLILFTLLPDAREVLHALLRLRQEMPRT